MTVFAVMTAGLFPLIHIGRQWYFYWLIPFPNERGLWPNFKSPLIWDEFAIGTYFTVSTLFLIMGLIPDIAAVRDLATGWRKKLYALTSIGWTGSNEQWRHYTRGYLYLAALATPLVLSVHSVVSWDFAMALVPGWHPTIFAPYFVAGGIYSGCGMVITLLTPIRKVFGLEEIITVKHFENLAKLCLLTGSIVGVPHDRAGQEAQLGQVLEMLDGDDFLQTEYLANRREEGDHHAAARVDPAGDEVGGENRGVPTRDERHREVPGDDAVDRQHQRRRERGEVEIAPGVVPPLFVRARPPDRCQRIQLLAPPGRQVAHRGDVGDQPHDQEQRGDGEVGPDRKLVPDQRRFEVGPEPALVRERNQPVEVPLPPDVDQREQPCRHHGKHRHRLGGAVHGRAPASA